MRDGDASDCRREDATDVSHAVLDTRPERHLIGRRADLWVARRLAQASPEIAAPNRNAIDSAGESTSAAGMINNPNANPMMMMPFVTTERSAPRRVNQPAPHSAEPLGGGENQERRRAEHRESRQLDSSDVIRITWAARK